MDLFKKSFLYIVGFVAVTVEDTEKFVKEQRERIEKMIKREEKPVEAKA